MIKLLSHITEYLNTKGIQKEFVRNGLTIFVIKVANMLLTIVMSIILARYLGADNYGIYAFALAIITLFAIPAHGGTPMLVLRETAKYQILKQWSYIKGLWLWSVLVIIFLSVLAVICLIIFILIFSKSSLNENQALFIGIILIPVLSLGMFTSSALRGLRHMFYGSFPESIILPSLIIISVPVFSSSVHGKLESDDVMMLHVISAFVVLLISIFFLLKQQPFAVKFCKTRSYEKQFWTAAILPLALVVGLQVLNKNIGILILGFFQEPKEVGLYKVAIQASILVSFGLGIFNTVAAPYISRHYKQKNYKSLQHLLTLSTWLSFIFALFTLLVFFFQGKLLLKYFYGDEFISAYIPLVILSFGQLLNAAFGSVGLLLNMSDNEKTTVKGSAIAAVCNLLLNFILVPKLGLVGASIAMSFSLIIWNLFLWNKARKKLALNTFILTRTNFR